MSANKTRTRNDGTHRQDTTLTKITFDSSYWGNEMVGEWTETAWVVVAATTDDAVGVSHYSVDRKPPSHLLRMETPRGNDLAWAPKSKVTLAKNTRTVGGDGSEGTLTVLPPARDEYDIKLPLTGDTYDALAGDDAPVDPDWDTTHCTYNGEWWVVDQGQDSIKALARATEGTGYEVEVAPGVAESL